MIRTGEVSAAATGDEESAAARREVEQWLATGVVAQWRQRAASWLEAGASEVEIGPSGIYHRASEHSTTQRQLGSVSALLDA